MSHSYPFINKARAPTCHGNAYVSSVHQKGREVAHWQELRGHQQTAFVEHRQNDQVTRHARLKKKEREAKLDVDPQRDDDASPMSSYRCMSLSQVKIRISNFFQIFGFPWCSTRDSISIDVSITNVGLILTKLRWLLHSGYRQTRFWNPHMETCRHTKKIQLKAQN